MTYPSSSACSSSSSSEESGGATIRVLVDGQPLAVPPGTVAAAAIALAGKTQFRTSVLGHPRGPLCGMGICMECRATINGQPFCRTCLIVCELHMQIETENEPSSASTVKPGRAAVL